MPNGNQILPSREEILERLSAERKDLPSREDILAQLKKKEPTPSPVGVGELPSEEFETISKEVYPLEPVEEVAPEIVPEVTEPAPPAVVPEFIPEVPTELPLGAAGIPVVDPREEVVPKGLLPEPDEIPSIAELALKDDLALKPERMEPFLSRVESASGAFIQGVSSMLTSIPETIGILAAKLGEITGIGETDHEKMVTYRIGQYADNLVRELFPINPEFQEEFITTTLPMAGGSLVSFMAGGAIGTGIMGTAGRYVIPAMMGSSQLGASEHESAFERVTDANELTPEDYIKKYARDDKSKIPGLLDEYNINKGKNPNDVAFDAFLLNAAIGTSEGLPVGLFFRRLDKVTGGSVKTTLGKYARNKIITGYSKNPFVAGGITGVQEGLQEVFQNAATNYTASQMYDMTRDVFDGNTFKEGSAGFILGMTLGAFGISIKRRMVQRDVTKQDKLINQQILDYLAKKQDQLPEDLREHHIFEKKDSKDVIKLKKQKLIIDKDIVDEKGSEESRQGLIEKSGELSKEIDDLKQQELDAKKSTDLKEGISESLNSKKEQLEKDIKDPTLNEESKKVIREKLKKINEDIEASKKIVEVEKVPEKVPPKVEEAKPPAVVPREEVVEEKPPEVPEKPPVVEKPEVERVEAIEELPEAPPKVPKEITETQKRQLLDLGYSEGDIAKAIPKKVQEIIDKGIVKEKPKPKEAKDYELREEEEPYSTTGKVFRAYDKKTGEPSYIGAETIDEAETRLREFGNVKSIEIKRLEEKPPKKEVPPEKIPEEGVEQPITETTFKKELKEEFIEGATIEKPITIKEETPERILTYDYYTETTPEGEVKYLKKITGIEEKVIPERIPPEKVEVKPLEIAFPKAAKIEKLEKTGDIEGIKEEIKRNPEVAEISPLIGMDIKGTSNFIADIPKKTVDFFQKYFTSKGFLPENVFQEKIKMEGATRAAMKRVAYTARDFKKPFNKLYKGEEKKEGADKIDKVLKGEEPISSLPEELHESISSMRNQIDVLSKRLVTDGVVEGELAGKVMDNLGAYMTRTYEVHDAPTQWMKFIETTPEGQKIKNKAISRIRENYEAMGEKVTDKEMDGIINELLYKKDAPLNILSGGKVGSKDLSILRKRKEIAPEIRALMGEYKDPLLNYSRSISKMANLIESHKFLNEIKDVGMDKFLFEKPTSTHFASIATEGSETMAPLNGLYTTPEIKKAFDTFGKPSPITGMPGFKGYMAVNGFVKYSKTILSLMTHIRNILGNGGFVTMNAHTSIGKFSDAIQITINNLAKLDKKDFRERYIKYLKLGVVYESANAGELSDIIKDASGKEGDFERIFDNRIKKLVKAGNKVVTSVYMAEDDVFKIYGFENELARYKKAYPEKSEAEVEKIAANIVRNSYPTYSLVPEGIKALRRFPLVGTFVSFPAEVVRTTYNTVELAINEMKNPATKSIGIKRIAGIMTAASATGAMALLSRMFYNVLEGDDDDMRRFVAPWTKNSQILYLDYIKNGKVKYVDVGYSDPHNYLKNPVIAILSEGNLEENGIEALKEFFEPFLGEEILAGKLVDIYKNKKPTGAPITNKQLPMGDQFADYSIYFSKALEPGTITSFNRIWRGIHGKENEQGRVYNPATEVTALFSGQRVSELDVAQSISFKLFRFTRNLSEANRIYNSVLYRRGRVSPEEIEDAYNKANTAREKLFKEINEDYRAALRLDVKENVLGGILERQRISVANMQSIKTGVYKPLEKKGRPGEEEAPTERRVIKGKKIEGKVIPGKVIKGRIIE